MAGYSKNLLLVNMLYSFIVAALAVMVPLYLLDRQVDISGIGLILAVTPLAFMVLRIIFASMADELGTRTIGAFYSLANLAAIPLYALSSSVLGFMAGTLAEGVRAAGFWAVIRTDILSDNVKDGAGRALAYFSGARQLADGLGRLAIGFVLAYLAFQNSFALLFVLSVILLVLVLSFGNGPLRKPSISYRDAARIFKKRPASFWHASIAFMFLFVATNNFLAFLLPLYSYNALHLTYEQTGGIVALLSIVTALATLAGVRLGIPKNLLILFVLLMVPATALMPFFGTDIILVVVLIGLGTGFSNILAEYLLIEAVSGKDVSTDIGVIYVPLRLGEFAFLSLGGFAISQWGYAPLFYASAILILLFVLFAKTHKLFDSDG